MLNNLNYLFLFQRLIKEGSLEVTLTNIFSLVISRDYIILDIENIKSLKKIIETISPKSENGKLKSFLEKIDDLKSFLSEISKIAEILVKEKKTFILKYNGEDILIFGYDAKGGIILKNIKIVNKWLLIKMLNEFKD
ncbi:hypothetical protein JH146_0133 [Methanocaldococcus bathoardescens]|uniref:Uncharacterized protein n=1 Tax=Methanocaldococcus bathoardescens TaxID=1301915 RepID=A0A076LHH9_9EURY|nr:hypothetical protein [Methanocaldococcus bathoardescens]AIJ04984.1 hypothetical protein JH146_0133 [Methanocaldococcus bathoardescens]